jgi:signal transduction histidine kinase
MSALQTEFARTTGIAGTASTTTELTAAYIQKLERQKYRAVALLLFLVIVSFIWLLFQFGNAPGQDGPALFSNFMYTLTSLIGAAWTFQTAYQASHGPVVLEKRHRQAWILIGLGLLVNGLGNIYYGYYQYTFRVETPEPSYADIGFTLSYLLIIAGLLSLPTQSRGEQSAIHMVIDSLITILCLLGISWYTVIYSAILNARPGQFFSTLVSISYPCWDILLLMAIILFIRQRVPSVLRPSLVICSLGVLAQIWADSAYSYLTSYGQYRSGIMTIDSFWFLGYLLIGLSALHQYSAIVRRTYTHQAPAARKVKKTPAVLNQSAEHPFSLAQSMMIYLPTTILLALTLYCQFLSNGNGHRELTLFLDVLSLIVLFLVTTHYVLAIRENAQLVREKEQSRADAELLRKSTASLSSVLEMDLLLSHIVTVGATELGFDAAALVLIEEYERVPDEQTSLLARAATSDTSPAKSWRINGQYIPFCIALMGKEVEILWGETPVHAPTHIHQWHLDQHIQASLFVPLTYQGRVQGSLAFSLRSSRRFTEREGYLARAFAEEAANAIEHAHLYELARENALFAEAMSNVAARLNSVVATGMGLGSEILHLICTEAANALSADLAILYVQQPGGWLIPLAALSSDVDAPTSAHEWPPLSFENYRALLPDLSQPALLQVNRPLSPGQVTAHGDGIHAASNALTTQNFSALAQTACSPTTSLRPAHASLVSLRRYAQPRSLSLLTFQESLKRRHCSTAILAPLVISQAPAGLLVLARTQKRGVQGKRAFASLDLEAARDFAWQAAIAFTNARLYQQLHNAHRRMQELDQLKDQFMVTASHELRTPLTAVQGYLELLENYHTTLSPEQLAEFLDKASRGCEELVLLLNNVMDASRLEIEAGIRPANLERVVVREVIEHVVDLMLLQATQENRAIQVSVPSQLAVRADPTRLRQVIRNLSVNALKYSSTGTPVLFSARAIFEQAPSVILSVSDRGKGIAPWDQGKLFQRFVRLESDLNSTVRGSGLGLYISRRLIEAMNGRIWIESTGKPGEGSTFCIQLPMA